MIIPIDFICVIPIFIKKPIIFVIPCSFYN